MSGRGPGAGGYGGAGARPAARDTGGYGGAGAGRGLADTGGYGGAGAGRGVANAGGYGEGRGVDSGGLNHPFAAGTAFGANHAGWYHGGWNGNYGGWGGYGWGGYGYGWPGAMAGLGSWGYGPMLYNMGYSGYSNPYYAMGVGGQGVGGGGQQAPYDYSQPIDTTGAPPQPSAKDQASAIFDQSLAVFKGGDYAGALSQCDQALQKLPNDPIMHEFRGLILFALGRYDDAAATLYGVLSAGPGWDWTTMISLYPDVDVYTAQLRALEQYTRQNPQSAAGHFDLAYQYLAQGHHDAAVPQLEQVVKLNPQDTLSPKLLKMFSKEGQTATAAAPPAESTPAKTFDIAGTWTANPAQDTGITLTVGQDGNFVWKVVSKGKAHDLGGKSSYGNNLLTLETTQGRPLVGNVTWQDQNHFTFQAAGGGTLDPGLNFAR
jgi:hypothetical protein